MYARFGAALIAAVNQLAPAVKLRQRHSEGSVDNAWLLARGEADYAIVQGDVAAAAVAGEDVFARGGRWRSCARSAGCFPRRFTSSCCADSPIRDVADLRGRRVDIGTPASGTRFDAVAVLAAYGLKPADLVEAREDGLTAAIARLRRGQIDALFATARGAGAGAAAARRPARPAAAADRRTPPSSGWAGASRPGCG